MTNPVLLDVPTFHRNLRVLDEHPVLAITKRIDSFSISEPLSGSNNGNVVHLRKDKGGSAFEEHMRAVASDIGRYDTAGGVYVFSVSPLIDRITGELVDGTLVPRTSIFNNLVITTQLEKLNGTRSARQIFKVYKYVLDHTAHDEIFDATGLISSARMQSGLAAGLSTGTGFLDVRAGDLPKHLFGTARDQITAMNPGGVGPGAFQLQKGVYVITTGNSPPDVYTGRITATCSAAWPLIERYRELVEWSRQARLMMIRRVRYLEMSPQLSTALGATYVDTVTGDDNTEGLDGINRGKQIRDLLFTQAAIDKSVRDGSQFYPVAPGFAVREGTVPAADSTLMAEMAHLLEEISTVFGVPRMMVTGTGSGGSRQTTLYSTHATEEMFRETISNRRIVIRDALTTAWKRCESIASEIDGYAPGVPGASGEIDTLWFPTSPMTDSESLFALVEQGVVDVKSGLERILEMHGFGPTSLAKGAVAMWQAKVRRQMGVGGGEEPSHPVVQEGGDVREGKRPAPAQDAEDDVQEAVESTPAQDPEDDVQPVAKRTRRATKDKKRA